MKRASIVDSIWLLAAVLASALVFANALGGDWVYDDHRQVVRNTLIQDGARFWSALGSDLWAFKGGTEAASDYWRPTFVLWLMLEYRLFGLGDTMGWHLASVGLHLAVVVLAWLLLRRFSLSRPLSAAICLLFAVHPVHVESVAWISGAPDLLMSAALLCSLLCAAGLAERATAVRWAAALGFYAIALGAKEAAILFPGIVAAMHWRSAPPESVRRKTPLSRTPTTRVARIVSPFVLLAVVYFVARFLVLGRLSRGQGGSGLAGSLLSAPAAFVFYLRQIVLPFGLGPSYPLRSVTLAGADAMSFALPLLTSIAVLIALFWLSRRSTLGHLGLALFLLPLAPALATGTFQPEQIVHDRYLYLPLLGFLILVVPAAAQGLERVLSVTPERAAAAVLIASIACAAPLAIETLRYNRAWSSDLALWEVGTRVDPTSAWNFLQYASALEQAGRHAEARVAIERSLERGELPNARLVAARVAIAERRFGDAERDLDRLLVERLADAYTRYQAYEARAVGYQGQQRYQDAIDALRRARAELPAYSAALTEKLAISLYVAGRKDEALAELEGARARALVETLPESRDVLFRLALLYAERGRRDEARMAGREYLAATAGMGEAATLEARAQVAALLRDLG